MAKQYADKKHRHDVIVSTIILISIFAIITYIAACAHTRQIDSLQEEIASMPHYECWNETTEEWRVLEVRQEIINEKDCLLGVCYLYENAAFDFDSGESEVSCENGVDVFLMPSGYRSDAHNMANETRKCFIKTTKEVCKLDKHDALLGADE